VLPDGTHTIRNQKEENFLERFIRLIFVSAGLINLHYVTVNIRYKIRKKSIFWKGRSPNHPYSADKWR